MATRAFRWKRFWCERSGQFNFSSDGYLADPEGEFGSYYNPNAVPFNAISGATCLALLGEPGIGKSRAMEQEWRAVDAKVKARGDDTLWIDLRSFSEESRLVDKLFESASFTAWKQGQHRLHLFLDSLDECLLRIDTVATLLIDELRDCPVNRLSLRIACRTFDWPISLEEELRELWGAYAVGAYELVPLRRVDVSEAASVSGLDPDAFLADVDRAGVVPLAMKPITLQFLIKAYQENARLPSTQAALYSDGCQLLCLESNSSRRAARRTGALSADERLAVASRIAAIMIFGKRSAVWLDTGQGGAVDEDITVRELIGGTEEASGNELVVTEASVMEVVGTGFFSSRGENRMGWAHQTYAEFLAARYLIERNMTVGQIMSLLVHPADPHGKLVPQLHATAAWLASMQPDVFRDVAKRDPQVLLQTDISTTSAVDKEELVAALLALFDARDLSYGDYSSHPGFARLVYPGLADQLRPYVVEATRRDEARLIATDIAEACYLLALQDDLVRVALDSSEPHYVRINAAHAVARIGDVNGKSGLKPLLMSQKESDPNDDLKGIALRALWPDVLTSREVFAELTPPRQNAYIGHYRLFVAHFARDVEGRLGLADLPAALDWVLSHDRRYSYSDDFGSLIQAVLLKAWENLGAPEVLEAFAKVALSRFERLGHILEPHRAPSFATELYLNDEKRRQLALAMVRVLLTENQDRWDLRVYIGKVVLRSNDVTWLIEQLRSSQDEAFQQIIAELIDDAFDPSNATQAEEVFLASDSLPALARATGHRFVALELGSPEAERLKRHHARMREIEERERRVAPQGPSPAEILSQLLSQSESEGASIWWRLAHVLRFSSDGNAQHEAVSDITALPGWQGADQTTRLRIIDLAKPYLLEQRPSVDSEGRPDLQNRPTLAGYKALRLLLKERQEDFAALSDDLWRKWAPVILAYPFQSDREDEQVQRQLVSIAYRWAPEEIIRTLLNSIDEENKAQGLIPVIETIEDSWDDRLAEVLLAKFSDKALKPRQFESLMQSLLRHNVDRAKRYAESLLASRLPSRGFARAKAVSAAKLLMMYTSDAGWHAVWPALQNNPKFGQKVILEVAHSPRGNSLSAVPSLPERELADLYIWVTQQFPHSRDPRRDGFVSPRANVSEWREQLLYALRDKGTGDACAEIERIITTFPHLEWIRLVLLRARDTARRRSWVAAKPEYILRMARSRQTRLVESGEQLLDVLIESLERLEAVLHDETPAVFDLWNESGGKTRGSTRYTPKSENRMSDYVKRHLVADVGGRGIVVNREVEVRPGPGPVGERTDIHVDAVSHSQDPGAYHVLRAVIESKGCWHKELDTAMRTQLIGQYLKESQSQHGIYLVGWFNCDKWDKDDWRRDQAPNWTLDEARQHLNGQAEELSREGFDVKPFVFDTALR